MLWKSKCLHLDKADLRHTMFDWPEHGTHCLTSTTCFLDRADRGYTMFDWIRACPTFHYLIPHMQISCQPHCITLSYLSLPHARSVPTLCLHHPTLSYLSWLPTLTHLTRRLTMFDCANLLAPYPTFDYLPKRLGCQDA